MSTADIIQLIGLVVVALGLIFTWLRSGHKSGVVFGEHTGIVDTKIKEIAKDVGEIKSSIANVETSINEQKVHCAKVSTALSEKVRHLEERGVRT